MRLTFIAIAVFLFGALSSERGSALAASEKLERLVIRVSGREIKFNVEVARTPATEGVDVQAQPSCRPRNVIHIKPS